MATTTRTNNSVILDEKKCALIQTTIWTNQGERGPFHTVTLRRSYKDAFMANAVDGGVLTSLTEEDLEALGVTNTFHRKRLLNDLAKLKAA